VDLSRPTFTTGRTAIRVRGGQIAACRFRLTAAPPVDGIGLGGFGHDFHTLNPPAGGVSALAIAFRKFLGNTLGSPMTYAEAAIPVLKALPTTRRRTIARAKVCT
jgi:hypothetical protein